MQYKVWTSQNFGPDFSDHFKNRTFQYLHPKIFDKTNITCCFVLLTRAKHLIKHNLI